MTTTVPSYKNNLQELTGQLAEMMPADKLVIFDNDAKQLAANHKTPLKVKPGDKAPLFTLPNAKGEIITLESILQQGAVVLTFYRGTWCPYCSLQLKNYQEILPQIKAAGASLIAVSPMNLDNSLGMKDLNSLDFEVLSDVGNKVAEQYTTVFKNSADAIQAMSDLGYDFSSFYDDDSTELPVPATFVIAQDGKIMFSSSVSGDYRERVEPQDILDVLGA